MLISKGEVIAVPTDTVYGLICDFYNPDAVNRIFELKNRSQTKPLVAFCKSISDVGSLCKEIPDLFYILADVFFPGPLTIILKKADIVSKDLTCGFDTIGVRIPDSKFINQLMIRLDKPLASSSANISNLMSFDNAGGVLNTFTGKIPLVIDGGICPLGLESTVIDLSGNEIKILREGFIKKELLAEFLQKK